MRGLHHVSFACSMVFVLAGCGAATEADTQQASASLFEVDVTEGASDIDYVGPASFTKTAAGELEISGDKTYVEVPSAARRFGSYDEVYQTLESELNAVPIRDALGRRVGVRGTVRVVGDVRFIDAVTRQPLEADDPVELWLAGTSGFISVAGTPVALASAQAPKKVERCNAQNTRCMLAKSWITHLGIYHSAGGKTKQTKGSVSGNSIVADVKLFVPEGGDPALVDARRVVKSSARVASHSAWGVGVGVDLGDVARISGVCTGHFLSLVGSAQTSKGDIDPIACL